MPLIMMTVYLSGYDMEGKSGEIISQWLSEQSIPNIYFAPGPRITFIEEETMNKLLNLKPILHLNQIRSFIIYSNN